MTSGEELADLAVRLAAIRKLYDELTAALGIGDEKRRLIAQLRTDLDAVYQAVTKKQS